MTEISFDGDEQLLSISKSDESPQTDSSTATVSNPSQTSPILVQYRDGNDEEQKVDDTQPFSLKNEQ